MSIALRPVTPGDDALLLQVYASTRQEEMAMVPWTAEQRDAFLQMQCTAQLAHYRTHYPQAAHLIILHDDQPAGRVYVDHGPVVTHILDVTVLPEYRNRGIGTAVVRWMMTAGKPVSIHVEQFNPSLRLFERLGFARVAEKGMHFLLQWSPAS